MSDNEFKEIMKIDGLIVIVGYDLSAKGSFNPDYTAIAIRDGTKIVAVFVEEEAKVVYRMLRAQQVQIDKAEKELNDIRDIAVNIESGDMQITTEKLVTKLLCCTQRALIELKGGE